MEMQIYSSLRFCFFDFGEVFSTCGLNRLVCTISMKVHFSWWVKNFCHSRDVMVGVVGLTNACEVVCFVEFFSQLSYDSSCIYITDWYEFIEI